MILFQSSHKVFKSVMNSLDNFAESLSIGSPQHNDLVAAILLLEVPNIFPDYFQIFSFATCFQNIVGSLFLVSSNEVFIVDWR